MFKSVRNPIQENTFPVLLEGMSVQHIKGAVFDDTVLLTGANFSDEYFVDRQDRYWIFNDTKALADYFEDLISALISNSYQMKVDGSEFVKNEKLKQKAGFRESQDKQIKIFELSNTLNDKQKESIEEQQAKNNYDLNFNSKNDQHNSKTHEIQHISDINKHQENLHMAKDK